MDGFLQIFALLCLAALISTISNNLTIFLLISSNSIIRLVLITSLTSVFTAGGRRLHYASLITSIVAPILSVFSNILTLVSPAIVPTLLSNFTYAAVVIALLTYLIQIVAIILASFAQAILICSIAVTIALHIWIQAKLERRPGEPEITDSQLQETLQSKIQKLCSDYCVLIQIYTRISTEHLPMAMAESSVRYITLSYYSVVLPAMQNAEASARVTPKDILVYAFTIALGMHITYNTIWAVSGSRLQRAASGSISSVIYVLRSLADLYWCLVTTGLIAVPLAEKELIGGSVKLFWAFVKIVLLDCFHRCLVAVSEVSDAPKWIKPACVVGMGLMWARCGEILRNSVDDVGVKFAARYAMK